MAKGFQLTAELNLRGPSNIRQVVGGIRKQLQGINTNLNININKKNIQGMQQANTRLAAINKTLQTTVKNASNATAAFNKLSASMRSVGNVKISPNIASGMTNTTKAVTTTTKAVQQATNEFQEFGKLGGLAIKRFAAFSVVTGAIYAVNNAITSGVKSFLDYDKQLTRVSQVLNTSRASLKGLDNSITALSTSLGVSSTELANVTVTLSQAGIQASDTRKALEALAKSALAPTFSSLTNTTEGAIAAMRQFSISAGQLEGALGSINAVAGKFAVEAGDIITAIQRTGGVFASASKGVSQGTAALNEFIAVFTSVRATSRESAETIATGLRTIFTRLQRQDTIDALKEFGVTLTDLEGKFVGPYKAIQLLSEGLRSLDTRDLKFAGIAEELGGFRQIGKVLPLIQQFGTAQQALNVAQGGSGSLARDAAKGQLALAVQIQKVREEFTALVRSISDSTGFRTLLTLGLDLSRVFIGVADALKGVLPLLAGLGAMKGLGALAGFTKGFGGVFKKAEGGYIHKFARGGTVPGTGSGDTVPAMLQPGEFVIRKKAVATLGTKRLHKMNKFGNGGKSKKTKKDFENLTPDGGVHFTHLDSGSTSGLPKGFRKVYTNMGLDLPANWNLNWAKGGGNQKDGKGADGKTLSKYIKNNRVFGSLLRSGRGSKVYGFKGRSESKAFNLLQEGEQLLSQNLANQVAPMKNFDTDNQVSNSLPNKLKAAIKQTFTKKGEAETLTSGFEEKSAYTKEGKSGRRRLSNKKRDMLNNNALGGFIRGYASGGNVQDTVPAMLTPGEFVINKSSASKLGTSTLNKLNNADRIKGYNRGGVVGFANGGSAPARPGTTMATIGVSPSDVALLVEVGDVLQQLGIQSSNSAALVEDGYQATYEAAVKAMETDLKKAKAVGANTKDLEANIKALKKQGIQAQTVSKALSGATGSQLQGLQNRLGKGQNIRKAASKEGIGGLANLAKAGGADLQAIEQYIAQASRDSKTLNSMDQRLIKEKGAHLKALGQSDKDIKAALDEEIKIRRQAVTQNASSQGARGPGDFGKNISRMTSNLGIGIGLLTSVAGNLGTATSAGGAAVGAGVSGAGMTFGAGGIATSFVTDLLPTDQLKAFGGAIGLGVSAVAALGQGLIDASNAARQFKIDAAFKKSEKAMEDVASAFSELDKDLKDVNIQNTIEQKLIEAGESLAKGLEIQNETAKMFWTNAIDVISSGGDQASVERSQILESKGFFAYMRAGFDEQFKKSAVKDIQSTQRDDSVRRFQPLAAAINKLVDTRADQGQTSQDIINLPSFDKMARSLAGADAATQNLIQAIKDNANITDAEKQERINNVTSMYAEQQVRKRVAVIARQKEIEALQKSTSTYTRSLERMYQNMEQSINSAAAALQKMQGQIDLNIASMQGQARVGEVVLDAINTLQNPRAFSGAQNQQATQRASQAFGSQSGNMSALINLGESIESSVMSSINNVLQKNPGATNAAIESEISKAVDDTLADLGLPPELADKMADEVGRALDEVTRKGGDTVDYANLSEKLASLNSVIEASKRAREIAIKVLEHQQKAMQQYTTNLNKVIDLEVSSRNYARKAVDILADAEIGLAKSLAKTLSVIDSINSRQADVRRQTGGLDAVDPQSIFKEIGRLETQRRTQQGVVNTVAQQGDVGTDDFVKFSSSVKDTSVQLRENIAALKDLAQNGDVAAAALNKIQEAQQSNAQKVGFFEKIVSSTPDELEGMNRAFIRLQRNLNGQVNTINQSVGAQKAYFEALKGGATQFEAMRAAQGAFAKERGESASLLKEIMPFLGDSEQSGGIRATALESMLRESGVGVNPMMQQVLNGLRNPETDPAVAAAIQQYKAANALQFEANKLLGKLDANLAKEVATNSETAFRNALDSVTLDFEDQQLSDIAAGVNKIVTLMEGQNGNRQGLANGGVVYAAGGQQIFQPQGTDTVPAMLTPGEFVVNRKSAQSNLPLLKNINNGYYAKGGLVTNWNRTSGFESSSSEKLLDSKQLLKDLNTSGGTLIKEGVPNLLFGAPRPNQDKGIYPKSGSRTDADLTTMNLVGSKPLQTQFGFLPQVAFDGDSGSKMLDGSAAFTEALSKNTAMEDRFYMLPKPVTRRIKESELDKNTVGGEGYEFNLGKLLNNGLLKEAMSTRSRLDEIANIKTYPRTSTPIKLTANQLDHTSKEAAGLGRYIGLADEGSTGWTQINTKLNTTHPGYKSYLSGPAKQVIQKPVSRLLSVGATADHNNFGPSSMIANKGGWQAGVLNTFPKLDTDSETSAINTNKSLDAYNEANKAVGAGLTFGESEDGSKVQQQLEKLYNGTTAYEEFKGSLFDNLPDKGIKSLLVPGSKSSTLIDAIKDKAKESEMLVAAGLPPLKGTNGQQGIFGYTGQPNVNGLFKPEAFDIEGAETIFLPWAANLSEKDLGAVFQEAAKQKRDELKKSDGTNSISLGEMETIKASMKLGEGKEAYNLDLPFNTMYEKYKGKLYDPKKREYTNDVINTFLPFKTGKDDIHLFNNIAGKSENLRLSTDSKITAENVQEVLNKKKQNISDYYSALLNRSEMPAGLEGQLLSTTIPIGPELLRDPSKNSDLPVFVNNLGNKKDTMIGPQLVASLKKKADSAGDAAKKIADGDKFVKGGGVADDALATTTKGLTKAALQLFGKYNFVRGVSGFLGRNIGGVPRNKNIKDPESAKQAAGFISNVFGQVGGTANEAFGKARNGRMAQFAKSAYVLASGAWQAFGGIAKGDTGLLQNFISAADDDGNISAGYAEGLFRSLGGGAALDAVKKYKLPNEYKDLLGKTEGGSIATVGNNGELSYEPLTDAIPDNVGGLMDLIFNPYNEFPAVDVRKNLIEQFQKNLNSLKGGNNLPFFDPKTSGFVNEGLNRLKGWYGGFDGWKGQDYLYDNTVQPKMFTRAQELAGSFKNSNYGQASEVNAAFGITNKFGNLPNDQWILNRGRLGKREEIEPVQKARGGMIYASEGQMINFQPKGTDTVPAMLTPGEFVVNRQATQANLPLLKSINRSQGGEVSYFNEGGEAREKRREEFKARQTAMDERRAESRRVAQMPAKERVAHYKTGKGQEAKRSYIQNSAPSKKQGIENVAKYDTYVAERAQKSKALEENPPYPGAAGDEKRQKMVNAGYDTSRYDAYHRKNAIDTGKEWKGYSKAKGTDTPNQEKKPLLPESKKSKSPFDKVREDFGSNKNPILDDYEGKGVKPGDTGYVSLEDRAGFKDLPYEERVRPKYLNIQQAEQDHYWAQSDKRDKAREQKRTEQRKRDIQYEKDRKARNAENLAKLKQEIKDRERKEHIKKLERDLNSNESQMSESSLFQFVNQRQEAIANSQVVKDTKEGVRRAGHAMSAVSDLAVGGVETAAMTAADLVVNIPHIEHLGPFEGVDINTLREKTKEARERGMTRVQKGAANLGAATMTGEHSHKAAAKAEALSQQLEQQTLEYLGDSSGIARGAFNVADVGKEFLFDPLTYVGGGGVAKGGKAVGRYAKEVAKFNKIATAKQKAKAKSVIDAFLIDAQKAGYTPGDIRSAIETAIAHDGSMIASPRFSNSLSAILHKNPSAPTAGVSSYGPNVVEGTNTFRRGQAIAQSVKATNAAKAASKQKLQRQALNAGWPADIQASAMKSWKRRSNGVTDSKKLEKIRRITFDQFQDRAFRAGDNAGTVNINTNVMSSGRAGSGGMTQPGTGLDFSSGSPAPGTSFKDLVGYKARGGMIYANDGMMIPRGTDTVPAMLTPGEFVVNRQASQSNLPLLKSINSGMSYFKDGGEVDKETERKRKEQADKKAANEEAIFLSKKLQIPLQEAYKKALNNIQTGQGVGEFGLKARQEKQNQAASTGAPSLSGGGAGGGNSQAQMPQMPQISQRQQAMTAQASQAAFDPQNSGDANKQLVIFGQVLTGVNQVLVQYGTVLQNLVGVQQQMMGGGGGGQRQGDNGGVSNGNGGLAEYTQKFGEFVQSLKGLNIPESINLVGQHTVNVNFAGGEQLGKALDEGNQIADFIVARVQSGLDNWVNEELPGTKTPKL